MLLDFYNGFADSHVASESWFIDLLYELFLVAGHNVRLALVPQSSALFVDSNLSRLVVEFPCVYVLHGV